MFLKLLSDIQSGYNIELYLCNLMAPLLLTYTVAFKIMQNTEVKILRTKEQGRKSGF